MNTIKLLPINANEKFKNSCLARHYVHSNQLFYYKTGTSILKVLKETQPLFKGNLLSPTMVYMLFYRKVSGKYVPDQRSADFETNFDFYTDENILYLKLLSDISNSLPHVYLTEIVDNYSGCCGCLPYLTYLSNFSTYLNGLSIKPNSFYNGIMDFDKLCTQFPAISTDTTNIKKLLDEQANQKVLGLDKQIESLNADIERYKQYILTNESKIESIIVIKEAVKESVYSLIK